MTDEQRRDLDQWLTRGNERPWPFASRFVSLEEWEYLQERRRGAGPVVAVVEKEKP
jgi:hypothetical protein